jgi:spore germination protein YaaH/5-hydroxyisourate hydrolase-like protein (transthyretin family)
MTASRAKLLTSKLLVVVIALSVTLSTQAHSANQPRKILTGWIPYYSMKTSLPAALNNADLIKEVMPFWYTLKYNGKTKAAYVSDLYVTGNPSIPIATPLAAMRAAGFQIIPTITDGTDKLVLSNLLANPTSRTQIAKTLNDYVMANNFDGIDLDFEGFAFVDGNTTWAKTAPSWVALVKELSGLLRANNKLLSVSTPYNFNPAEKQKGYTVYAWPQIAPYIDRLRIMTYDYSVSKVGPIGPLAWTEKTVAYAASIMPASKVYLGLAGYGRDWVTKVDGVCPAPFANAIKAGAKAATFVMRDAAALAASYQVTPVFDAKFGEATFTYTKSYEGTTADGRSTICTATRTAWYQNAQSYKLRSELVAKYKLGGVTAWTLGMEEPLAMEAIRQTALGIAPVKVISALTADKTAALYGNSISISAQLNLEDKSPAANLPLRIEGKSASDATWRVFGTAVTGVDGRFTTPILLGKSTAIRIATDGTWERAESLSNEISILVDRTLSISAPGTVKANSSFAIDGVVRPRSVGAQVSLMKFSAGAWKKVAIATTNEQGVFAFAVEKEPRQVARYQIIVEGDQLWRQVAAPEFSIIIR